MPISSIQYRAAIENYPSQVCLARHKQKKISRSDDSKKLPEIIRIAEQIFEAKNRPTVFQSNNYRQVTISKQNAIKTSLLALILLSQIRPGENVLLEDANDFSNFSVKCNTGLSGHVLSDHDSSPTSTSWTDALAKIPQNIANSFAKGEIIYDPLRFPGADAASLFEKNTKKNHTSDNVMRRENNKLSYFLKKQGILDKNKEEKITKEELISDVISYCSSVGFQSSRSIARKILSASRPYESEKHESLSSRQVKAVIRNWVFKNILNASPAEYVAKIISNDKNRSNYTIHDVVHILSLEKLQADEIINLDTLSVEMKSTFKKIWHNYMVKEMPFLHFYNKDKSVGMIVLNNVEFSNLYTGARYLSELNSLNRFNRTEALEVGKKMWGQAINDGIDMAMQPYFLTPSLFSRAQGTLHKFSGEENIHDTNAIIIREQLEYRKTIQQVKDKLDNYKVIFRKWLQRGRLIDTIEDPELIDNEHHKLRTEVADHFAELDKYLIPSALNSVEKNETNFIFSPNAIIRSVILDMQTKNNRPVIIRPFDGAPCPNSRSLHVWCTNTKQIKVELDKTDLFSVSIEDDKRIYALKHGNGGYSLFRVDWDISKYIEADILDYKEFKNGYSINNNKITVGKKTFHFKVYANDNPIKRKEEDTIKFIDFLRNTHRDNLYASLHQAHNEPPHNEPSNLQKIWGILKHFIPLYDCINGSVNKDLGQAIPGCLSDSVIFIPVIGQAFNMAEKFAVNIAKGVHTSGISLRVGSIPLTDAAKTILKTDLPTIYELSSLEKNSFESLNPGFQLLGGVSKKHANKLINYLNKDEETASIAEKLKSIISTKQFTSSSDLHITARLPDSEIRVPVRKVGKNGEEDTYAIFNPETGESGWARFIMKENNQLAPLDILPEVSISKELEKIIIPDMYTRNIDLHELSPPDHMGLRWDANHSNAYLKFKKYLVRIIMLNNQPFLVSENHHIPLIFGKDYKLKPEGFFHRLKRLKKAGLSGKNQTPKQVIASKLNIIEEQAADLLSKYEFPEKSHYYSDKTFALWIKETGQIPEWAEPFKILDPTTYLSRFRNIKTQDNGLYSFSGAEGFVYRVDKDSPEVVLTKGFTSSEDYTALEKMIPESEPGLTVSGDITGALRYNELVKSPYIYKIKLENIRGVSLKENLMKNQNGLKAFLGENADEAYKTIDSLAANCNGAIYLDEVHLYSSDIKSQDISILTREEIEQVQPLSEGPWRNYL